MQTPRNSPCCALFASGRGRDDTTLAPAPPTAYGAGERSCRGKRGALGRAAEVIALAEQYVREGEEHVAHQRQIVETLDRDGHERAATMARQVLATLQHGRGLVRTHLEMERAHLNACPAGTPRQADWRPGQTCSARDSVRPIVIEVAAPVLPPRVG